MRHSAWLIGVVLLMATGCSNARLVDDNLTGGVVAIPNNSDSFPYYNMTHAKQLIAQQCPKGYTITDQGEFITGTTTTTSNRQESTEFSLISWIFRDVKTGTQATTETVNKTEFRITYQKNQ
ncbi:MAG TPA: hypothetical protein VFE62_20435 [Gemmataceae bacterium]|nr:hypothetical protein [Gemmataceae bacterium]